MIKKTRKTSEGILSSATISLDQKYRYILSRSWFVFKADPMVFCMLNPSTADGTIDDPTIRRCMGFARRENRTGIVVINLFALRSSNPGVLRVADDPFGPDRRRYYEAVLEPLSGKEIVLAWGSFDVGNRGAISKRMLFEMLAAKNIKLMCLGVTKDNSPRHPLYIKADQPLIPYDRYALEQPCPECGVRGCFNDCDEADHIPRSSEDM
jgi:hypothetical protein